MARLRKYLAIATLPSLDALPKTTCGSYMIYGCVVNILTPVAVLHLHVSVLRSVISPHILNILFAKDNSFN